MRQYLSKEQRKQGKLFLDYSPVLTLVSGIFMGLTVAPVGAWYLAWIALAPLWILVVGSQKDKLLHPTPAGKQATSFILHPLAWGIGYHGVALSWITGVHPMTWMGVPWLASLAIALFCWGFITLWGAAIVVSWAVAVKVIFNWSSQQPTATILNSWSRVLIGVALWCGLESLWSWGPLYWTGLAYTQSPNNLAILHLGQISGPTTVTAAIVAVNGLIAESWINRKRLGVILLPAACCLLIGLHLVGWGLYSQPLVEPPATALRVGIIQGNVPNSIKLYPQGFRRAIEGYTTGYKTLADRGVDAVLTPEGALPFRWDDVQRSSFAAAVREKGVVAWVGAFGAAGSNYTNSLFTLTGTGETFSRYNKVKLVPVGEYVPFEPVLGGLIQRLSPLDEHQVAGSPDQVFETPFGRAIAGICYESAFSHHFQRQAAAGGEFILSASNNAHYSPAMPSQHHAQDLMRAIETDRWAVRATNTGYSGIVDPHGRTEWISELNTYELHAATIYRRQTQTLYVRWGDWLTLLLIGLSAIAKFAASIAKTGFS